MNSCFEPMFDHDMSQNDQWLALGKYVPAVSSPVGGRNVGNVIDENVDMNVDSAINGVPRLNEWGRDENHMYGLNWQHSDMKDMAYFYVYKLYEQLVQKGNLR